MFLLIDLGPRACIASRMAFIQAKFLLAQIILNYEVYRSEHTKVPPNYIRTPQQSSVSLFDLTGFQKLKFQLLTDQVHSLFKSTNRWSSASERERTN